jgi:hypothetical protein
MSFHDSTVTSEDVHSWSLGHDLYFMVREVKAADRVPFDEAETWAACCLMRESQDEFPPAGKGWVKVRRSRTAIGCLADLLSEHPSRVQVMSEAVTHSWAFESLEGWV